MSLVPATRRRRTAWGCSLLAVLSTARHAPAQSCTDTQLSSCVDSGPLWIPVGASEFASIDATPAQPPLTSTVALSSQYSHRPILLNAPGPDPYGTEIEAVGHVLDLTLGASLGLVQRLEIAAAFPVVLSQSGTGVSAGTSLQTESIASVAPRDPRLTLGFDLFDEPAGDLRLTSKLMHTATLPLGDETAFAGERGLVNAPQIAFIVRYQRLTFGTELGFRFRAPVQLADARVGNQFTAAIGAALDTMDANRLLLSLEAWTQPSLVSQLRTLASGTSSDSTQVPAEWLLSGKSALTEEFHAQLGFGTAIPISSSSHIQADGVETNDRFAALPSAQFRILVALRYILKP